MAKNIDIDTEKLLDAIKKLEKARNDINTIFETSSKGNKTLNDHWSSDTSKVVDEEFDRFDKAAKDYISKLDGEIEYLKNTVTDSYIEYEDIENKLIDDNIATN